MNFSGSFSCVVLGAWIGGSACVWGFVTYNFLGYEDLFARNPKLAARAEFDPADSEAKKTSLLWVHSSELNRVVFEYWNLAQMGLAAVALIALLLARLGVTVWLCVLLAGGLVIYGHFSLMPEIVALGRGLDFVPRSPPPEELGAFGAAHGKYLVVAGLTFALVLTAAALALRGRHGISLRRPRASPILSNGASGGPGRNPVTG